MTRTNPHRMCGSKVAYASIAQAKTALASMGYGPRPGQGTGKRGRVKPYACVWCGGYHLGHRHGTTRAQRRHRQAYYAARRRQRAGETWP